MNMNENTTITRRPVNDYSFQVRKTCEALAEQASLSAKADFEIMAYLEKQGKEIPPKLKKSHAKNIKRISSWLMLGDRFVSIGYQRADGQVSTKDIEVVWVSEKGTHFRGRVLANWDWKDGGWEKNDRRVGKGNILFRVDRVKALRMTPKNNH